MSISKRKPKKDSMMQIINKYSHNHKACVDYFFNMKWPTGFYCEKCGCVHYYFLENRNVFECAKCGHQHYLFAGTIFQDNKLPLFLHEQEWRFNHRYTGTHIMEKISKYITKSFPIDSEKLSKILELSELYFSPCA